jgi:hypothetical protein
MGNDKATPMSVAIAEATRYLHREIALYWVDGGLPENFSLPGFDPAPIIFSTRFIEIQATLLRLLRSAQQFNPEILSAVTESISLQVAAALVLEGGDPATASYLMTRSEAASRGVWITASTIYALELEEKNASYMTVWFYALLHEIGHVFVAEGESEGESDAVGGQVLAEFIQEALDEMSFPPSLVEQLTQRLEARGLAHSLHPKQISAEIMADLFAIQSLWRATATVMERDGRGGEFSPVHLAICVYEIYNVLIVLNNCAFSARRAATLADLRDEPWVNVSYRVRLRYVLQFLARLLAGDEESESASSWYSQLAVMTSRYADHLTAMEAGQARAMRQVLYPAERDEDLASLSAERTDAPFVGLREFITAADSLGIEHPDIERLRCRLERTGPDEDSAYAFSVLWISLPDGTRVPFSLPTKYGDLVFVFSAQNEMYSYFRDESADMLNEDYRFEEVTIVASYTWQVAIICAKAVPVEAQGRTSVLVEGSALFDRMIRELSDGSIWPTLNPD